VVRVRFGSDGAVTAVEDFLTGILPLDVTFAPDGAMWLADTTGVVLRIAGIVPR
jgi:hypothetical protein